MRNKILSVLFAMGMLFACKSVKSTSKNKENLSMNFTVISTIVPPEKFEKIQRFILKNGDRRTYRNFDNHNPHYKFLNCEVFLGADIGQRNGTNDPAISNFNQLTITDYNSVLRYYELIIVRKGDLEAEKAWIREGMEEEQVYLVDVYGKGLALLKNNLPIYLEQIEKKLKEVNEK
ncbi:hypothetical protein [Cellulophaga baltica]|uniref:Lipoprotein n=1 Tax=Cellulophaga baltica TaxID=76594 RepID=A0A1G7GAV8_9FLAO|nr:hypothetical protein [Cellulophaga baltica]SDE85262.1 hypothetical protein SAMN04487992_104253 [Cellulophaga baltica]